jgi:hypothetical protein
MVEPITTGAIILSALGVLRGSAAITLLGLILLFIALVGTSFISGIPIWILGIMGLIVFLIISRRRR